MRAPTRPGPAASSWRLRLAGLRGIHRAVLRYGAQSGALGLAAGWLAHQAWQVGLPWPAWLLGAAVGLGLSWLLAWRATRRLFGPLRELARVAESLRAGQLEQRRALPQGEGEVGEVASALGGVAERLARQLEEQRTLLAAVSHELRSPLGRARLLVELSREGQGEDPLLDELDAEITGMDRLVEDLLTAARVDFEAVQPRVMAPEDLLSRAAALADGAGVVVRRLSEERLLADPALTVRALGLLVDNARRHGGGVIELLARSGPGGVQLVVRDRGPGFPEGQEDRAFEAFWRGPGSASSGLGLGLALVRRIARAQGGEAFAANRPGGGAEVWLELPRSPSTPS